MKFKQKYKRFFSLLGQWLFFGSIIGIIVGSATAFLLEINDFLGTIREEKSPWFVFFLPLAGILIGYIYMRYGKVFVHNNLHDAATLNNLVIEEVFIEIKRC